MALTFDDLARHDELVVTTSLGEVTLQLVEAEPHPEPHPGGSLVWRGPAEPALAQGTYPVRAGTEEDVVFLVPLARDPEGHTYQAVYA